MTNELINNEKKRGNTPTTSVWNAVLKNYFNVIQIKKWRWTRQCDMHTHKKKHLIIAANGKTYYKFILGNQTETKLSKFIWFCWYNLKETEL